MVIYGYPIMYTVLYVDDEPGLLELGKAFLEMSGSITVETALSAEQGIQMLKKISFDCIISDYQMPVMDGIKFLKFLRHEKNTIPFILFTGRGREDVVIEAVNSGVDYYLQKGGDPQAQFVELEHKTILAIKRWRTENELKESRQRMTDIIDHLPDATFAIDINGKVIAWNRAMEEMTGVTKGQILGTGNHAYSLPFYGTRRPILLDLILREDPDTVKKYPHIIRKDQNLISEIFIPLLYGGRGAFLWFIASPLYDTHGNVTGAIESIRDVTIRKKAEEDLQESEERYRAVIEDQTEFITRFLPDGTHVIVNEAYCRYFGKTPEEIIGTKFVPRLFDEDKPQVLQHLQNLTRQNPVETMEHRIIMPDGQVRWQQWSDRAIFDESGNLREYQSVGRDITDRKKAEDELRVAYEQITGAEEELREQYDELKKSGDALRESEEKYRSLVNNLNVGVYRNSAELPGRWLWANPAFLRMFGYESLEEFQGLQVTDMYVNPEERRMLLTTIREQGFVRDFKVQLRRKDGTPVWVSINAQVKKNAQGTIQWIDGICNDITDKKQAEEALLASEERLMTIIEQSPLSIQILSTDGRTVKVNQAFVELWGLTLENLKDYNILRDEQLTRLGIMPYIRKGFSGVACMIPTVQFDSRESVGVGEKQWVLGHIYPVRNPDGIISNVIVMHENVTDHKKADDDLKAACARISNSEEELRQKYEELQKSQEALLSSEEMYRAILNNTGSATIIIEADTTISFVNPEFERIMGYTKEEIEGNKYWTEFVAPEDVEQMNQYHILRRTDPEKAPRNYEFRFITKEQQVRNAYLTIGLIPGTKKTIASFVDITENKHAEEALRESERNYRTILENIQDVYYRSDRDGIFTMFSPSGLRLLGYGSEKDLLGKSIAEAVYADPSEREKFLQTLERDGFVNNFEVALKRRDGTSVIVETSSHKYYDETGNFLGVEGIFHDITERKQAKVSLESSVVMYRTIFENTGTATVLIEDNTIIFLANAEFERLSGYSREEIEGKKSWTEFVVREDLDRMRAQHILRRERQEAVLNHYEFRFITKSGAIRRIFLTIDIIPGTRRSVASLMDITDKVTAREALKQTNKKLNLINSITRHDMANQLSTLTGFIELSKRKVTDPELLRFIEKEENAVGIILEQIEFAKNYETIGTHEPQWQRLENVIPRSFIPSSITLEEETGNVEILADPMLNKVFYNLIDNSVRHGQTVTEIRISFLQDKEEEIVIIYEDNGTGIPASEKELIFNREFGKNTGLGLFLIREILAITGISIRETGTPGTGARFEILVPKGTTRFTPAHNGSG